MPLTQNITSPDLVKLQISFKTICLLVKNSSQLLQKNRVLSYAVNKNYFSQSFLSCDQFFVIVFNNCKKKVIEG